MGHFVKKMATALLKSRPILARNMAAACIALAGAVHLFIVPEHFSHSEVHGSFFAVIGAAQLLWALLWFRWRPSSALYWAGLTLSGGIVVTWILAFFVTAPYSSQLGPIGAYLTASKLLEFTGLLALIAYAAATGAAATSRPSRYWAIGRSLVVAVMAGATVWAGGIGGERIYPQSEAAPVHGSALSHGEVHSLGHEAHGIAHLSGVPAASPQPTTDVQALADAAVQLALETGGPAGGHGQETPVPSPAEEAPDSSIDSGEAPAAALPLDIQAMIDVAVDRALGRETVPTPTPGLPSDIQAMVAEAVAAALNSEHALTPAPDQMPGQHGPGAAGTADTSQPELVVRAPTPQSRGPAATLAPTSVPSPRLAYTETPLSEENKLDPKLLLFGAALVALLLIAVVGAVKTWNDIT